MRALNILGSRLARPDRIECSPVGKAVLDIPLEEGYRIRRGLHSPLTSPESVPKPETETKQRDSPAAASGLCFEKIIEQVLSPSRAAKAKVKHVNTAAAGALVAKCGSK